MINKIIPDFVDGRKTLCVMMWQEKENNNNEEGCVLYLWKEKSSTFIQSKELN